jgi:CO/xanthine dehydrogenase FAD-binding subunit
VTLENNRAVRNVRLGLGGVADTPVLVAEVQQLAGEQLTKERAKSIAEAAVKQFDFPDDYQASSAYRRQLATVLMSHVLVAAYEDALAKEGTRAADQG